MSGRVRLALFALLLLWAGWRAAGRAWLCDDAFITFRYAENLAEGRGLVYNAGERVEGYTNLLWTLYVAGMIRAGFRPETAALAGGIACWLALAGVLAAWSWRRARPGFFPLAAAAVLLMDDWQTWATGGLETSLFALLATAGMLSTGALAGTLLALAVATRPDGVVFAAVAVASCAWRDRRHLTALIGPLALAAVGLIAFKLGYYGELFPTAFHSKSALRPYWGQGLLYVALFLWKNWAIALGLVALAVSGRWRGHAALLAAGALFAAYVVHSGGDFMFARRLLPALPVFFIIMETALDDVRARDAVCAVALAALCVPYPIFAGRDDRIAGIANEPAFYPPEIVGLRKAQGEAAAAAFAGVPVRALFEGGMCMFGYYSRLPYLAEATGLTQYSLAKRPLVTRGHVGHEKGPDDRWLSENRIHLIFRQEPVMPGEVRHADAVWVGARLKATLWTYDHAVMDPLQGRPNVKFTPIGETLARAEQKLAKADPVEGGRLRSFLDRFYQSWRRSTK
jgi:hypothetical protein